MNNNADQISDYYAGLQQRIFYKIIRATQSESLTATDRTSVDEWRLKMLSKMGALTSDTIKLVTQFSKKSEKDIRSLVQKDGLQVAKDINSQLSSMLNKKVSISDDIQQIINGYTAQTFKDIDNNVNQTLLSTNYSQNGADKTFQDIVNKTALEVQTGLKTPQRALADNIYKWRDEGIKSNLVDKGGHRWSLEGYTRTVLNSTAGRTFNDVRIQSMCDFKSPLAVMSSHPMSRKACAYIQGHIVNIVAPSDPLYNDKYDSIYNHGYGTPAGTLGINCAHHLYPYIEGVSHNYQTQYDPEEAQKNADVQAKQRYYERSIRSLKYDLDLAEKMNDKEGQGNIKSRITNYQAKLRDIVNQNDFLNRQYDREQIANGKGSISSRTTEQPVQNKTNTINNPQLKVETPTIKTVGDFKNAVKKLGVDNVDVKGIAPEHLQKVYKTIKQTYEDVPAVKNIISSIESGTSNELGDAVAQFGVNYSPTENKLIPKLKLNSSQLDNIDKFNGTLKSAMDQHYWTKHSDFTGIVKHELAHAIGTRKNLDEAVLDSLKLPDKNARMYINNFVKHSKSGAFEKKMLKTAFKQSKIEMNDANIAKYISYYGKTNYKEAFAEAYSNEDSSNPITANLKKALLLEMKKLKPIGK